MTAEMRDSKFETRSSVPGEEQSSIDNRPSKITVPLLLEVGCEEIPARFLPDAEKGLGERVQAALAEARLLPATDASGETEVGPLREAPLQTYSTPRRLVVHVPALLAQQPDKVEEILGPPVRVAFTGSPDSVAASASPTGIGASASPVNIGASASPANVSVPIGSYSRAAVSFAQKNSARLEDLTRTTTPKGEYLALRKTIQGRSALEVLPEILPATILGLNFPKSMYWLQKSDPRFVRPIRWVLAVLGEGKQAETVKFEILGVKSGDFTFGHRVHSKGRMTAKGFGDYRTKLRRGYVEFDGENRRQTVQAESNVLLESSLKIIDDLDLEEWVVNSTEWPSAIRGGFDERFLYLPPEILITVMRGHQKYFAVENLEGKLEPHFIAILNVDSDERGLIRRGHERVLQARFRDAEFFWDADQRTPLRERLARLEKVTYQAELGSYAGKVRRMQDIARRLCDKLEMQGLPEGGQRAHVLRAVELSKCDLTTQMVQELAELQGVVGGLYARAQGEPEEVATAIYDHYLPRGAEDRCPRSLAGDLVSLADKLDAVVAGFAVGYEPSGSSDPFAIRRQANGVIRVLLELPFPISLDSEIEIQLNALHERLTFDLPRVLDAVQQFMRERLAFHLENVAGLRYDTVRAALEARAHRLVLEPLQTLFRARAIERIRSSQDFFRLSQSAKRIRNILSKSAKPEDYQGSGLDPARLEAGPERDLFEAYERARDHAAEKRAEGDIYGALESVAALRSSVDAFFDKVLVLAEDPAVRRNRLHLLFALDRLFTEDADLSQIEKASESVSPQA
jgi:glycyl-tRNA synthetase beta chain